MRLRVKFLRKFLTLVSATHKKGRLPLQPPPMQTKLTKKQLIWRVPFTTTRCFLVKTRDSALYQPLMPNHRFFYRGVGRGAGVGRDLGVGVARGWASNDPISMRPFTTRSKPGPRWS